MLSNRIAVIGAGALGSRIIFNLARLNADSVVVYDKDVVEEKNVYNQTFDFADIGLPKVDAVARQARPFTSHVEVHNEWWTGQDLNADIIISAVDDMDVRKELMEYAEDVQAAYFLEGRMTKETALAYIVNVNNAEAVSLWHEQWYPNESASNLRCGRFAETAPMAELLAAMIVRSTMAISEGNDLSADKRYDIRPSLGMYKVDRLKR